LIIDDGGGGGPGEEFQKSAGSRRREKLSSFFFFLFVPIKSFFSRLSTERHTRELQMGDVVEQYIKGRVLSSFFRLSHRPLGLFDAFYTVETTNCVRQSEFSGLLGGVSGDSKPNSRYS